MQKPCSADLRFQNSAKTFCRLIQDDAIIEYAGRMNYAAKSATGCRDFRKHPLPVFALCNIGLHDVDLGAGFAERKNLLGGLSRRCATGHENNSPRAARRHPPGHLQTETAEAAGDEVGGRLVEIDSVWRLLRTAGQARDQALPVAEGHMVFRVLCNKLFVEPRGFAIWARCIEIDGAATQFGKLVGNCPCHRREWEVRQAGDTNVIVSCRRSPSSNHTQAWDRAGFDLRQRLREMQQPDRIVFRGLVRTRINSLVKI